MRKTVRMWGCISLVMTLLAGCGSAASTPKASEAAKETKEQVPVTQIMNWYAQADQGGQYAAQAQGFYKEAGIDMTIQPGGPQISTVQVVSSGKAQFGMAQGDQVLMARAEGIPLVAVASLFQVSPQIILFQKNEPIQTFGDLNGRTVFVSPGSPYWEYIKKKYKLDQVNELAFTGDFSGFLSNKTSGAQAYLNTAPFSLKEQGIETNYLKIYDSGYQPYANVLFTTEKVLKENPKLVKAYVEASVQGWNYYKDHYKDVNPVLLKANPNLNSDLLNFGAESQRDLVFGGDAVEHGVGYMAEARWTTLMKQLLEAGLIKKEVDVTKVFTNEFLPAPAH